MVYETRGKMHYANHSLMWINITVTIANVFLHRIRTLFHQQFKVYMGEYSSGRIQTRLNVAEHWNVPTNFRQSSELCKQNLSNYVTDSRK